MFATAAMTPSPSSSASTARSRPPFSVKTPSGGQHFYFRYPDDAEIRNSAGKLGAGLDVRGEGGYVVTPPSEGYVVDEEAPPAEAPAWLLELPRGINRPSKPVEGEITQGVRHEALVSLAGTMRRRGMTADEIFGALKVTNEKRLRPKAPDSDIRRIADSVAKYAPNDKETWTTSQTGELPALTPRDRPPGKRLFTVVTLDAGKARSVQYAMPNRFLVGYLNAIVGRGGSGKGTLASYLIAGWTQGTIPGAYYENPVDVLLVGDEDDFDEMWTPRIGSVGGDLTRVHGLDYTAGTPLNFERDIGELEAHVREHDAKVLYADQILDHIADTRNTHTQADVRHALSPLRGLARRLRITVIYSQHPNKRNAGDLRDLSGARGSSPTCRGRGP